MFFVQFFFYLLLLVTWRILQWSVMNLLVKYIVVCKWCCRRICDAIWRFEIIIFCVRCVNWEWMNWMHVSSIIFLFMNGVVEVDVVVYYYRPPDKCLVTIEADEWNISKNSTYLFLRLIRRRRCVRSISSISSFLWATPTFFINKNKSQENTKKSSSTTIFALFHSISFNSYTRTNSQVINNPITQI